MRKQPTGRHGVSSRSGRAGSGLLLEPVMPARHFVARLRRSDGGWVAAVEMTAASANQQSRLPEALDGWVK
jgi:hypothetical protein